MQIATFCVACSSNRPRRFQQMTSLVPAFGLRVLHHPVVAVAVASHSSGSHPFQQNASPIAADNIARVPVTAPPLAPPMSAVTTLRTSCSHPRSQLVAAPLDASCSTIQLVFPRVTGSPHAGRRLWRGSQRVVPPANRSRVALCSSEGGARPALNLPHGTCC